jgi:hypothetical protein
MSAFDSVAVASALLLTYLLHSTVAVLLNHDVLRVCDATDNKSNQQGKSDDPADTGSCRGRIRVRVRVPRC